MRVCQLGQHLPNLTWGVNSHLTSRYFSRDVAFSRNIANSKKITLNTASMRLNLVGLGLGVHTMSSIRAESNMVVESDDKLLGQNSQKEDGEDATASKKDEMSSSSSAMTLSSVVNEKMVALDKLTTDEKAIFILHKETCEVRKCRLYCLHSTCTRTCITDFSVSKHAPVIIVSKLLIDLSSSRSLGCFTRQ